MVAQFTSGYGLIISAGADLPQSGQDAKGIAQVLTDPQRCAYPREQVMELSGVHATRQGTRSHYLIWFHL